jgi:antirestriction protein ArdC
MEQIVTRDIFEIVTNLIIQKLEGGVIPWRQPWINLGPPRNLITQRPYRGINLLLLGSLGYDRNEFLTFKQVQDLNARVKKGSKANLVVLWHWIDETETARKQDVRPRKRPILRYYHVFNVSQCVGIPENNTMIKPRENSPIERCESIVANMPNAPNIVHNENEAYYHPAADFINMPAIELFESSKAYYGTLFHELIHSTGHTDRLNRKELMENRKAGYYSTEELIAEIGSCYLTSFAGVALDELKNSVAYLQGWLEKLRNDKKFIVYASAQAQKATDYILNIKHSENEFTEEIKEEAL